ncbi:hypothetical protein [Actinoplanes ianthinogenes]|uniref:hypothetical protein n=1 Tax=Actinoplanes ianthinogenes TaxID=122358 RepID=UPI00167064D1|nr:hypothetical protein [Actinoplanes ianthinogenes]
MSTPAAATAQLVAAAGPLPNDTVQALADRNYIPPVREAAMQLRAWLHGAAAAREDIFRVLLLFRGRGAELQAAYAERYGRELKQDLARMPDPADRLRAYRYLDKGELLLADYLYLYPANVAWVIAAAGDKPATWRTIIEQQLDQGFKSGLYLAERRKTGRLPDGTTDSLAAGLFDQLWGAEEQSAAKSLYTFGTRPPPLDKINTGLLHRDRSLFFEGLREYFAAPGRTEQQLIKSMSDIYQVDLQDQFQMMFENDLLSWQQYQLTVAGGLAAMKRVQFALAAGDKQELFAALASADPQTRADLFRQLTTRTDSEISRRFHAWFNGLTSDEEARAVALVEDPAVVDPAVHRIRALGGADGEALVQAAMFSLPTDFDLFHRSYRYGTPFYRYVREHTTSKEELRFAAVVEPDLEHRLRSTMTTFDNPGYLLHLLRHFVPDDATRGRIRADTSVLRWLSGTERDEAEFLLAPVAQPLQRAVFTVRQLASERSVLTDWRAVGAALSDATRELNATTERAAAARTAGERAAEIGRLTAQQERAERIRVDYVQARDTVNGFAKMVVQAAVAAILEVASAGVLTPAAAEIVMVQVVRVAVVGGASRLITELATERNVTGGQLGDAFVAGAAQGVIDLVGASAAEHLLTTVRAAASAGFRQSGGAIEQAIQYGQTALTSALGAAVESAANDRTWAASPEQGLTTIRDAMAQATLFGLAGHAAHQAFRQAWHGGAGGPPPGGGGPSDPGRTPPDPIRLYASSGPGSGYPVWYSGGKEVPPPGPHPELITSTASPPRPDLVIHRPGEVPQSNAAPALLNRYGEPLNPAPPPATSILLVSGDRPQFRPVGPAESAWRIDYLRARLRQVLENRSGRPPTAPTAAFMKAVEHIQDPVLARAVWVAYQGLRDPALIAHVVARVMRHAEELRAAGRTTVVKTLVRPPHEPPGPAAQLTLDLTRRNEAFLAALIDLSERVSGRPVTLLGGHRQFQGDEYFTLVAGENYRYLDVSALVIPAMDAWTHGASTHLLQELIVDRALAMHGLDLTATDLRRRLPGIPGSPSQVAGLETKPSGQWIWEEVWDILKREPSNPNYLNPVLRPFTGDLDAPLTAVDPDWAARRAELLEKGVYLKDPRERRKLYRIGR